MSYIATCYIFKEIWFVVIFYTSKLAVAENPWGAHREDLVV